MKLGFQGKVSISHELFAATSALTRIIQTLLCIAHRLKTIIDYDRICVMDQGRIAELDTPANLYSQGGIFRSMCERSGIHREDFRTSK
jgi:ABC-type multidrug transport system fused ATPase/permease subunit